MRNLSLISRQIEPNQQRSKPKSRIKLRHRKRKRNAQIAIDHCQCNIVTRTQRRLKIQMNYLRMWPRIKRFVLVILVLLALANFKPGDGDKQEADKSRKLNARSQLSKLSRRTDPGGGIRGDSSAEELDESPYGPTTRPGREPSVDNQLDLYLLAGENPTSTPVSVDESDFSTPSESAETHESTPSNRPFVTTISSLAEALSLEPSGALIESPEELVPYNDSQGASLNRARIVTTPDSSKQTNKSATMPIGTNAENNSLALGTDNEDPHLVRNKKSPKPNSTEDSSSESKLSSPIVGLNSTTNSIGHNTSDRVTRAQAVNNNPSNSNNNNNTENRQPTKPADSSGLFGNALEQIDYDDFDLDYQLKLNATHTLLPNSESQFASQQPTKQDREHNPQAPSISPKIQLPNWSNLVGPLSHLFDSTDSLNLSSANAASASDIGPVPSVLTLKSKQLTKQELNTLRPQFLSLYQDSFEPANSAELSQPANGDLLATASYLDAISHGSLLNESLNSIGNLSIGASNHRNETTSRDAIINLLNGSPVTKSNQRFRDFPSIGADDAQLPNALVAEPASIDPMLSSSTTSKPLSASASASTTTTGTPSAAGGSKGSSDNNHWFNYPHPKIHQNPLLLHHLINKPALYAPNIEPPFDLNQTTTSTSAPETRLEQGTWSGANNTTTPSPTVIERPSQSRSFTQGPINQTQLEMQLNELRALATNRQRLTGQPSNPLGTASSSQHPDYTSFKLADNRHQKVPLSQSIHVSSNSVPFHTSPGARLSFAMHKAQPNSFYSRQPIQLPLSLPNKNMAMGSTILASQADRKQNQLFASQLISAPSLLQDLYSPPNQQSQWPNAMSSSNRIAQISSSSFNHSALLPSVANVQSLDELMRLVELYYKAKQQHSAQAEMVTLNRLKTNELNHEKPLNSDDQMSHFVSNLSSTGYMSSNGPDIKGSRDNQIVSPNQQLTASKSADVIADHIQLFSLPQEEQAKLLRDLTLNRSRAPANNPNLNHYSRPEAEAALQALALAAFLRRDKDKDTANRYGKNEHSFDATTNMSHLDTLRLLASLQQHSNNRPTDKLASSINKSNSNFNSNFNSTSSDLNSQAAEPSSSTYTGKYNNFDDNIPHSSSTMRNSNSNSNSNHQESERQVVQESLLVESSRVNPFGQSQRSSYYGPNMPFNHVASPSFRPQFVAPAYIQQAPSSFRVVPASLPLMPGYQLAASQMSQVQQPVAMAAQPSPPPQMSLMLPHTSQSRPALPLIAPPPPMASGPDPAKLLVDRFPFVSAPAYLIKLPTLTGGTITASGSFKSPVSLLRNRHNPSPFDMGSRMRIVTTSQPAQPGVQINSLPIQMSPSALHPLHHSPPTHYGQHRAPIMMGTEADQYVSASSGGSRLQPPMSLPMYPPHASQILYDNQPQMAVASPPMPMQKIPLGQQMAPNHAPTTSSYNHTEPTDSITATGTTQPSTGYNNNNGNNNNGNNNKLTQQNSDTSNAFKDNQQPSQTNSQTKYRTTFAGSEQPGTVSIQPTVANAALTRLQQATASLVELTSLASLVDEILSSSDREPSAGAALVNAINSLSLTAQNPALSAQASSSSGTINDSNPNPSLASSAWRNLFNAGVLWRDKLNYNNNLNKAKIERLVANANQKATTRLRVKYIRVPVAVYETTNGDGSSAGGDSVSSNELILATKNPISAKSFMGQVSLPAVPITAGSLDAVSSISDQLNDAKSGSMSLAGSASATNGNSKSASSNSYMFDEMSSDSSPQLALTMRDLLESSSHSNYATNRPISFDSGNPGLILELQARRPSSLPLLIKPRVPLSLIPDASSLLSYQSALIGASSSPDLQSVDSIAAVKEIGSKRGQKRGKTRGRSKGHKEHHIDINDDDEDEEDDVSADDLMSAEDLSLLESLISTVSHPGSSSLQHPYQGDKHSLSSQTSHRTPMRSSSPWRLRGAFSALKNLGAEPSNQVETFAPMPASVSNNAAKNKDFAMSLLKHSNRLSLGELIGALGARRLIMGLLSRRKASRTTSKRAVSPTNEQNMSDVYLAAKLKGPKLQATNSTTSSKATGLKGMPSMYPYIGTFESSVQKGEHFNRQHQAAMNMIVNRNRQHSHRNETSM